MLRVIEGALVAILVVFGEPEAPEPPRPTLNQAQVSTVQHAPASFTSPRSSTSTVQAILAYRKTHSAIQEFREASTPEARNAAATAAAAASAETTRERTDCAFREFTTALPMDSSIAIKEISEMVFGYLVQSDFPASNLSTIDLPTKMPN